MTEEGATPAGTPPSRTGPSTSEGTMPVGTPPAATRSTRTLRATLFWLLAPAVPALAVTAAMLHYWRAATVEPSLASLGSRLEALAATSASAARESQALRPDLTRLQDGLTSLQQKQSELERQQSQLNQSLAALATRPMRAQTEWVLAEVEFLLIAAAQRLQFERDAKAARAALVLADDRLRSLDDPHWNPARQRIVADSDRLAATEVADVAGLALRLSGLVEQIEQLPLRSEAPPESVPAAPSAAAPAPPSRWQEALTALKSELAHYVIIRKRNGADDVALDPSLRALLQASVRAELTSAKLAILRRDAASTRASIDTVRTLFDRYLDPGDARVKSALELLDAVAAIPLDTQLPDIADALQTLRALRASAVTDSDASRTDEAQSR